MDALLNQPFRIFNHLSNKEVRLLEHTNIAYETSRPNDIYDIEGTNKNSLYRNIQE